MVTAPRSVRRLAPDLVVLVADAGLGTINAVRLTVDALREPGAPGAPRAPGAPGAPRAPGAPIAVVLNRFDAAVGLHIQNAEWLRSRDGLTVVALPGGERELAGLASG